MGVNWQTTNPAADRLDPKDGVFFDSDAAGSREPRLRPASDRIYLDDLSYEPQLYLDLLPVTFASDNQRTPAKD